MLEFCGLQYKTENLQASFTMHRLMRSYKNAVEVDFFDFHIFLTHPSVLISRPRGLFCGCKFLCQRFFNRLVLCVCKKIFGHNRGSRVTVWKKGKQTDQQLKVMLENAMLLFIH